MKCKGFQKVEQTSLFKNYLVINYFMDLRKGDVYPWVNYKTKS